MPSPIELNQVTLTFPALSSSDHDHSKSQVEEPVIEAMKEKMSKVAMDKLQNGESFSILSNRDVSTLHWTTSHGLDALSLEIIKKADQNFLQLKDPTDLGNTALHSAVRRKSNHVVDALVKRRANVHAMNSYQQTPLFEAAIVDNPEAAKLLLRRGASTTQRDISGLTPIHWAIIQHSYSTLDLLLKVKIAKSKKSKKAFNINQFVTQHTKTLMLGERYCNESEERVELQSVKGDTLLHLACRNPKPRILSRIVRENIDPEIRNSNGETAKDIILVECNNHPEARYQIALKMLNNYLLSYETRALKTLKEHSQDFQLQRTKVTF